ncbi:hypothetical protein U1Q18_008073 [Sarracenia purpurea var. burkii]
MQARRLLRSGCKGYLASVRDISQDELDLENILVAREFPDVFPEDLPVKKVVSVNPGLDVGSGLPWGKVKKVLLVNLGLEVGFVEKAVTLVCRSCALWLVPGSHLLNAALDGYISVILFSMGAAVLS